MFIVDVEQQFIMAIYIIMENSDAKSSIMILHLKLRNLCLHVYTSSLIFYRTSGYTAAIHQVKPKNF